MDIKIRNRSIVISLIVIVMMILIIIGVRYWQKNPNPGEHAFPPIPVEVALVKQENFTRSIKATGQLVAQEQAIIRPEVAGIISEIPFTDGQVVEKNALLFKLRSETQETTYQEAQANLALSQLNYNRFETLLGRGAISISERDTALSKFRIDTALVHRSQAALDKTSIEAPFAGTVGIARVNVGDYINPGDELVNLVNLSHLYIDFKIPEIYLSKIKLDEMLEVSNEAFPGDTFKGKLIAIDPQIDPVGHSISLRGDIPNIEHILRPGLFMIVHLIVEEFPNALFVPETAIVPQGNKVFVYKVIDNKAMFIEVTAGLRQDSQVQITSGLKVGEMVITAGQLKLHPGAPVKPINLPARTGQS